MGAAFRPDYENWILCSGQSATSHPSAANGAGRASSSKFNNFVMTRLVRVIHVFLLLTPSQGVDGPPKAGHDDL